MRATEGDETRIGASTGKAFETLKQFSVLEAEQSVYFVALGSRSRELLEVAVDAEAVFDPENFDEDGYAVRPLD